MSKYKDIEGAVPVNGDVTPITRRKIEKLDTSRWYEMNISELTDQRIILNNRIMYASTSGNGGVIQQLQRGLAQLDQLIAEKSAEGNNDNIQIF